jgi:hypothetical protein
MNTIDGYAEFIRGHELVTAKAMAPQVIAASNLVTADCFQEVAKTSQTIMIRFEIFDLHHRNKLSDPVQPPKLHYTTFWRKVTRRIYHRMYIDV